MKELATIEVPKEKVLAVFTADKGLDPWQDAIVAAQVSERMRIESEEQANKDRIQAAENIKRQQEQAERDRIAAKEMAEQDAMIAAEQARKRQIDEQKRIQDEVEEKQKRIQDEVEEKQKRLESNRRHVGKIRKEAKESLMLIGLSEDDAKNVVMAIHGKNIDNVSINY